MRLLKSSLSPDLDHIQAEIYIPAGLVLTHERIDTESQMYDACSFELNGLNILHRTAKITPAKNGQFVTIWKRDTKGQTTPFSLSDGFHFFVITVREGVQLGQFVFPSAVLASKGILASPHQEGKRGIRVYPPWVMPSSKQAEKTQHWQIAHFLTVGQDTLARWVRAFH